MSKLLYWNLNDDSHWFVKRMWNTYPFDFVPTILDLGQLQRKKKSMLLIGCHKISYIWKEWLSDFIGNKLSNVMFDCRTFFFLLMIVRNKKTISNFFFGHRPVLRYEKSCVTFYSLLSRLRTKKQRPWKLSRFAAPLHVLGMYQSFFVILFVAKSK